MAHAQKQTNNKNVSKHVTDGAGVNVVKCTLLRLLQVSSNLFLRLSVSLAACFAVRLERIYLLRSRVLEQQKLLDPIRDLAKSVCSMDGQRDSKDLIQFFERPTLGLADEQEDKNPDDTTPGGIPPKGTLWFEGKVEGWICNREHEVPEPSRCGSKRHADVTNVERECFGGVGKRNRAFSW